MQSGHAFGVGYDTFASHCATERVPTGYNRLFPALLRFRGRHRYNACIDRLNSIHEQWAVHVRLAQSVEAVEVRDIKQRSWRHFHYDHDDAARQSVVVKRGCVRWIRSGRQTKNGVLYLVPATEVIDMMRMLVGPSHGKPH